MLPISQPRKIVHYSKIDLHLPDQALKDLLIDNLNIETTAGSSSDEEYLSDDELAADSGRTWRIVRQRLNFGYRHPLSNRLIGTTVKRTSMIPICDKVLTRNGNSELTSNEERVIRKLSQLLHQSFPVEMVHGTFRCVVDIGTGLNGNVFSLRGDRPFPYFYATDAPRIKGYVLFETRIYGDGRKVTFVRTGGQHWLSDSFRGKIVYLL